MQEHQRRILGRVLDEVGAYRDGRQSMVALLNNAWALFEAAEVKDIDEREHYIEVYLALSSADDANQPWMPTGLGSDEDVVTALAAFERYAVGIHGAPDSDTSASRATN